MNRRSIISGVVPGRMSYRTWREKEPPSELICEACKGTGLAAVKQPLEPTKKTYSERCAKCGGKGRLPALT